MTSRRPMARSFSGNGRTGSFSEEEGGSSNGRSEGRNTYLSNVRPENRSTLCSVMAQLTEDIQPCFETTLKSKAVSENCNVKFTCVVSGYPAPELKWYKDDMEMDRYCGLPKYEIHRNGKNHTLHIYNCTLDDAAIYQVSASNSKGIVSCSGVLEVGTMNEYEIHQRFFAKLKQKAENKKRELEASKKKDKEKVRQVPIPPPEERPAVQEPEAVEQLGAATVEPNGVSAEAPVISANNDVDKVETAATRSPSKKKIKISNGVNAEVSSSSSSGSNSRNHTMGNGGENSYDGGIGLAQFLAETLSSQASEEKHNSLRAEKPTEMDTSIGSANKEKEREQERKQKEREEKEREKAQAAEYEREKRREQQLVIEKEKERERQLELSHKVKGHSKAHKDHDHHHIQASLSSVLHSVKDFFFGKGKKDSHDHRENEEREVDHPHDHPQPQTPPLFRLQPEHHPEVYKPLTEEAVPMEMDKPEEPPVPVDTERQSASPGPLTPHEHEHEDSVLHTQDLPPAHKLPPETEDADEAVKAMEVSVEVDRSGPGQALPMPVLPVLTEAARNESQAVPVIQVVPVLQQEPTVLIVAPQLNHQAGRDQDPSGSPQTQPPSEETCFTPSMISAIDSQGRDEATTETSREKEMHVDKMGKESDTREGRSPNDLWKEEKAEVKPEIQPCTDINRPEVTELIITPSLEDRIKRCDSKTSDSVPVLIMDENIMAADSVESDHLKAEAACTPLIQEMNVVCSTTVAPESSKDGDLKILQECASPVAENLEDHDRSAKESLNSALGRTGEGDALKDVFTPALEEQFEHVESAKVKSESLQTNERETEMEIERETRMKAEELEESTRHSETRNDNVNVPEEPTELGELTENVPEIQISTIENIPDITLTVPEIRLNEEIIIPENEAMEPEIRDSTQPLPVLTFNTPESESHIWQEDDATNVSEVITREHSTADSPAPDDSIPTQKSMLNDDILPPTEKVQEVVQLHDKTETQNRDQPFKSTSELPQMSFASIPTINISCTDDKTLREDDVPVKPPFLNPPQPDRVPRVPLFVVPPISIICDESPPEIKLPTQKEWAGAETLAVMLMGTKSDLENDPEKPHQQNPDKMTLNITENSPSTLHEAVMPTEVTTNVLSLSKTTEDNIVTETLKSKPPIDTRIEPYVPVEDLQRDKSSVERLGVNTPTLPPLSPASLRRFLSKAAPGSDPQPVIAVPAITVGDSQSDKTGEELSGGSTPTSSLSCESSPRLKRRDSLSLIRSATPEELASGARRKIFMPRTKSEDGDGLGVVPGALDTQVKKETPYMSPSQARRAALLQAPTAQHTPPMERRSPLLSRRKATLEVPKVVEETPTDEPASVNPEDKPAEKEKLDPFKAPQVIRKIRGEPFPDASGHLKLWCQFFNVLSDSTIKWYRDEEEIIEVKRSGGDESQVALAVVQASSEDCAVYGCSITNQYGTDTTDFLLSVDILSEILLKDDFEVGEEIEMTPMLFTKGLAESGSWGDKFFGRIMTEQAHIGEGPAHKASRVKVIYGLDPVFESGSPCIIKIQSPIAYGTKEEQNLPERNLAITKQECKIQNTIREYCKIFAAEARVIENFGCSLEVVPQYLMYRPANSVPYATVEAEMNGVFLKYCMMDTKGRLINRTTSEVEQKCSTFQHWIHQWTHGNLLVIRLEGVQTKLTNVRVVTKSKGYQGLTECGSPKVFEQFLSHHQCNYYCGLLSLRPLKTMDSLQQPTKIKGSRSPLINRKLSTGSSSPQLQRKSPQISRKGTCSPKVPRKAQEAEDNKVSGVKPKPAETLDVVQMR